jgi:hypothetical protein
VLAAAFDDMGALAKRLDQVFQLGQVPVTALTRCAAAIATLPVVVRHNPEACVVWFDAHADLNTPQTSSTGYLGGMALSGPAGLWRSGLGAGLSVNNIVLVGARDMDPCELALVESGRVKLVPPGVASWQDALAEAVDGRPVYVHLDCDVLEPGIVPTEYRVPGGLSLDDLRGACAALAQMAAASTLTLPNHAPADFIQVRPDIPKGKLETITYNSKSIGVERKAVVYLPPNYDPNQKYPVLYLMHGIGGNETHWTTLCAANMVLDNLIADK